MRKHKAVSLTEAQARYIYALLLHAERKLNEQAPDAWAQNVSIMRAKFSSLVLEFEEPAV